MVERPKLREKLESKGQLRGSDASVARRLLADLRHARDQADRVAKSRGVSPEDLLREFPRYAGPPSLASIVTAALGRLVTPLLIPAPCSSLWPDPTNSCGRQTGGGVA
jgi:hypothetical protein